MIPHILHRIWLGSPIPAEYEGYWASFRRLNHGWEFRTWREDDLDWLTNQEQFDTADTYAQKADIARYEVLLRHGGIYVDTDIEPLRPLAPLLDAGAFAAYEDSNYIAIGVMGCTPGHPLFAEMIRRIPENMLKGGSVNMQTGPMLFTRIIHSANWDGLRLYPPKTFYPYSWKEDDPGIYPEDTFLVHHWASSWT